MTSDKELWLDVDGVLLDWCRPFIEYHHSHSGLNYDDIADYGFSNFYKDSATDQIQEDIRSFNRSEAYGNLPPLATGSDLKKLVEAGYTLRAITQITEDDAKVKNLRMANLAHNFPGLLSSVHFTFKGEDKLKTLLDLRPEGRIIVVEDNPSFLKKANATVADELHRNGQTRLFAFGIRHPYNKEIDSYPYIMPVDDMSEVTKLLHYLDGKKYVA